MKIKLTQLGKRFNTDWVFRNLNFQFDNTVHYAITGPNGSGKSTLLQIISGAIIFNEGEIKYTESEQEIKQVEIFQKISFAAPYLELIEEMTLIEFLSFHHSMKGWLDGCTKEKIITLIGLEKASHKQIRYYSSGMKQRVKLAQAVFSNTPVVLLDEPTTNLDEEGVSLYHFLIKNYCSGRVVIVSSNDRAEYLFCNEIIDITRYK